MTEHQIDLKALLVEKPDCDAGTVQQLRNALAQGGTQYRTLRDVTEALKKKLEGAQPAQAKVWNLKIGIASFFLGYTKQAIAKRIKAEMERRVAKRGAKALTIADNILRAEEDQS